MSKDEKEIFQKVSEENWITNVRVDDIENLLDIRSKSVFLWKTSDKRKYIDDMNAYISWKLYKDNLSSK